MLADTKFVQVAKHIYMGPKSARQDPGCHQGRRPNAVLSGITTMTPQTIAYAVVQVSFCLSQCSVAYDVLQVRFAIAESPAAESALKMVLMAYTKIMVIRMMGKMFHPWPRSKLAELPNGALLILLVVGNQMYM